MAMQVLADDTDRTNLTNKLFTDCGHLLNKLLESFEPRALAAIHDNLQHGATLTFEVTMLPHPSIHAVISTPDGEQSYTLFATKIDREVQTTH